MKTYMAASVTNCAGSLAALDLQLESIGLMAASDTRYNCQMDSFCRKSSARWTGARAVVSDVGSLSAAGGVVVVVEFDRFRPRLSPAVWTWSMLPGTPCVIASLCANRTLRSKF